MAKNEVKKRREGIVQERIGSWSESRRVTEQLKGRLEKGETCLTTTDDGNVYVSVGIRLVYLSAPKRDTSLTPRKAEIIGLALIEAAKIAGSH